MSPNKNTPDEYTPAQTAEPNQAWDQYQARVSAAELASHKHEDLVQAGASDEEIARVRDLRQVMKDEAVRYGREQGFLPEPPQEP